jgi:hypothetical protein
MSHRTSMIRAFLQGMTGAGLFRWLDYPGAPTHAIDPRPVEEILRTTGLGKCLDQAKARGVNERVTEVAHQS